MNVRVARLRNLLLLIAVFASIVVMGSWDNRRDMQRVFDTGYPVLVQVTGAQEQRLAPFALDGWRPRFVEQAMSVDLKWDGKDGKPHQQAKVPVTEQFAATIVSGDQVRTAVLPAKVVDDGSALPVINADASARYASVQTWLATSGYVALAAWAGFAGITVWWAQRGSRPPARGSVGRSSTAGLPPGRTLFGLAALVLGAVLVFRFWAPPDQAEGAPEITAEAALVPANPGNPASHNLRLSWKDPVGGVHHYGPVPVSDGYWAKISRDGVLTVHQVRIRYREADPQARPVLVGDDLDMPWQSKLGIATGIMLIAAGAASLVSAARQARRGGNSAQ
jgi:hypothetical protein